MKMSYRKTCLALTLITLFFNVRCHAQKHDCELGQLSSAKRLGLSLTFSQEGSPYINCFTAAADMLNKWKDADADNSWQFSYGFLYVYKTIQTEKCRTDFYAGPGCSLGYRNDFGKKSGSVLALYGEWGMHFDFNTNISLRLGFSAELGLLYDRKQNPATLSLYKEGLAGMVIPEFTVLFRL